MAKINHWGDIVNFGPNAKDQINNVALRSLLIANRLNFYWPKNSDSGLTTLASAIGLPTQWAKNLRHLHTARPQSMSMHEVSGYPSEERFPGTNRVVVRRASHTGVAKLSDALDNSHGSYAEKPYTGIRDVTQLELDREAAGYEINGSPDDDDIKANTYSDTHLSMIQEAQARKNRIYLINDHVSPYIKLEIETRPHTLNIEPKSQWVSVKSMGRNNPFYFYTGGEDSISFEVSWFILNNDSEDYQYEVLSKCRLLESWAKANYYYSAPPTLRLIWGDADIFSHCRFIIESCPYTLTNFNDYSRIVNRESGDIALINGNLLPACATQKITLKRVTSDNTTHDEIWTEYKKNVRGITGNIEQQELAQA